MKKKQKQHDGDIPLHILNRLATKKVELSVSADEGLKAKVNELADEVEELEEEIEELEEEIGKKDKLIASLKSEIKNRDKAKAKHIADKRKKGK